MGTPSSLILGEKDGMTEGKKAGWARKLKLGLPLSSKSGSTTGSAHHRPGQSSH